MYFTCTIYDIVLPNKYLSTLKAIKKQSHPKYLKSIIHNVNLNINLEFIVKFFSTFQTNILKLSTDCPTKLLEKHVGVNIDTQCKT